MIVLFFIGGRLPTPIVLPAEAIIGATLAASFTAWPATTLPVFIVNEPTCSVCNLNCSYCFYRKKELVCPSSSFRMSDEVLNKYI